MKPSFDQVREYTAMLMIMLALVVISWLALHSDNDAKISLISVVSAGVGWALRGKVQAS